MGLQLPANFKNDIQGRDTNLFPVVAIGTWAHGVYGEYAGDLWNFLKESIILSTTPFTFRDESSIGELAVPFKPILLNVPSLKESIDIEKRNYKISNINIDISNFPHDGKRFSDLIAGHATISQSLINVECRIYWWSPSVNAFALFDLENSLSGTFDWQNRAGMQVYNGVIRRYTHDDEKVRLVVEDRSQVSLHTELPRTNAGENVPDKYKNKYIPMVYGNVDRSPLVLHSSISEEISTDEGDETNYLEVRLKADEEAVNFEITEETQSIGTLPHTTSALYFYENNTYHNVHKTMGEIGEEGGVLNFTYGGTDIVMNTSTDGEYENDFSKGFLRLHAIRRFDKIGTVLESTNGIGTGDEKLHLDLATGDVGRIYGTVNCSVQPTSGAGMSAYQDYTAGYFKCILEPITIPSNLAVDNDNKVLKPDTWLFINVVHYNFFSTDTTEPPGGTSPSSHPHVPDVKNEFSSTASVGSSSEPKTHLGIWSGNLPAIAWYAQYEIGLAPHLWNYNYIPASFDNINSNSIYDNFYSQEVSRIHWFDTLTHYDHINIGIPRFLWSLTGTGAGEALDDMNWGVDSDIQEAFILQVYKVMGIVDKEYYASVRGRLSTTQGSTDYSPQAPHIFEDILETELGYTGGVTMPNTIAIYTDSSYYDWTYAFTIPEKKNSKKLIEELASASPYIPRFDNLGKFRIDVIRDNYIGFDVTSTGDNGAGASENHVIKEADIISFSFSRTKIEDVKTKVVLKYKWNYGKKDFDRSHEFQIYNEEYGENWWMFADYKYDYYGIPQDNKQSTLTVDDDRSKYIRSDIGVTANRFTQWLLMWHCNQHLILKTRLPLKYMNLEIGDIIQFDNNIGGIKPYGINYKRSDENYALNGQVIFPHFMVTETNKTLEYCDISCIQMHNMGDYIVPDIDVDVDIDIGAPVYGCMDSNATNYNPDATFDDPNNPCIFPSNWGCMDTGASNYDSSANLDCADECCEYPGMPGCTDSTAINFHPEATEDDGSCEYGAVLEPISIGDSAFVFASDEIEGMDILDLTNGVYNLIPGLKHFGVMHAHAQSQNDQWWVTYKSVAGTLGAYMQDVYGNEEPFDELDGGFWGKIHGGFHYAIIREGDTWYTDKFLLSTLDWSAFEAVPGS